MTWIGKENRPKLEPRILLTFDAEVDALYVNFKKPSYATDSEITDDDVIVRYEGDVVIGFTVLHASERSPKTA